SLHTITYLFIIFFHSIPFLLFLSPYVFPAFFPFFFFTDTATTEIYTLSLHDALPIFAGDDRGRRHRLGPGRARYRLSEPDQAREDRKSTRLNSSHLVISYAVFCLKKKKIAGIKLR